MLNLSEESGEE
jgi:hypothetical protein